MKSKYAKKIILLVLLLATVIIEAGWLLQPVDNSNLHREKQAQAVMERARATYINCHMTNTKNTPVEALEYVYPFRVTRYAIRTGSGGEGGFSGGDGMCREYEFLQEAQVTILSDRRMEGPYCLAGGQPGQPGLNQLRHEGETRSLPGKCRIDVHPGDILTIETPGGGGYGENPNEKC